MKFKVLLFSILIILMIGILTEWMGVTISKKELFQSCQPTDINYKADVSYCVRIIKLNQWINSKTVILVSQKNADPDYGYVLNFPTFYTFSQEEFDTLKVEWKPEGVLIETLWNDTVFIPAKNITQSR